MKPITKTSLALVVLTALAGCSETTGGSSAPGTPSLAEQACLQAVNQMTNNPDVVLSSSSPAANGGTQVVVAVGEQKAPWQCVGYSDGSTTGIMSLTNEGAL